ncbi:MAG TPA: 3-dehydroquinate synthase family protein, partial [Longimicrobiaceae bacterium]|nr:3-dehydroquinate synthase family protein [Longimicrobiaceae bacterium]
MHEDTLPHRVSVPVAGASSEYEILVGAGLQRTLPEILTRCCPAHRYALITDERVRDLYGISTLEALRGAALQATLFAFPAGEEHKTRESWAAVTDAMLTAGIGRDGAVLALGGGVPGDLAGFVAATYMRGLPWVQLPTTLLAMIDASIGGKTGVDAPAGKNLVGAFHPPRLVVADTELLRSLPLAQLRAGLAEAVKHGAIADAAYLRWIVDAGEALLAAEAESLLRLVVRSIEIKADVVARDERESGPRKMLNFGHTLGHAIEAASHYR